MKGKKIRKKERSGGREEPFHEVNDKNERDVIALTIELMQKKTHALLTLQELADFSKLSVSHFSALFRERTGSSPIEYFNHLKVQQACRYLLSTNMTVKEIAARLGVDDPYYFSRMFSKEMGLSPSGYRKRNTPAE